VLQRICNNRGSHHTSNEAITTKVAVAFLYFTIVSAANNAASANPDAENSLLTQFPIAVFSNFINYKLIFTSRS
jgi:hypothetical protein